MVLILAETSRFGVGAEPDTAAYVSAARSLASGQGFVTYDDTHYVDWPPCVPVLLALGKVVGLDAWDAFRWLNALAMGATLFASGLWMLRHIRQPVLRWAGSAATLLSIPLLDEFCYGLSEPLFLCFTLFLLLTMERYLERGKRADILLATLFAALACLTRYSGVALVAAGIVALCAARPASRMTHGMEALAFGGTSLLPLVIWCLRNQRLTGSMMGSRVPASVPLTVNLDRTLDVISGWFLPAAWPLGLRGALFMLTLLALCGLSLTQIARRHHRQAWFQALRRTILPLSFLLLFCILLIYSASRYQMDELDTRLLCPVYIPLLWLLILCLDVLHRNRPRFVRQDIRSTLLPLACVLWLLYPLSAARARLIQTRREGAGEFSTQDWHDSDLIAYLQQHPLSGIVYSNNPAACYLLAGVRARWEPENCPPERSVHALQDFETALNSSAPLYCVWFTDPKDDSLPQQKRYENVTHLKALFTLSVIDEEDDGIVYRLQSVAPAANKRTSNPSALPIARREDSGLPARTTYSENASAST
jgi:hypothetical protein